MKIFKLVTTTIIFLLCCPLFLTAQVVPSDTTSADTLDTIPTDTTRIVLVPLARVGSIARNLAEENVIPDSAIDFLDYKYLGDLISTAHGVFIRDLGSPGQLHGLTINGLDARGIAVMNDGILLNDPLTGIFDLNLYPTENIERLEMIRGSRAFLYALNSTGGTINIVTKSKKAITPESRIRFSQSSFNYGFVDGMISQDVIRGLNVTAGLQHTTTDGKFDNSGYDYWNARAKVRYNLSSNASLYVSEIYSQSQLGLNGGIDMSQTPSGLEFGQFQAIVRNDDSYEKITRHDLQLAGSARLFADTNNVTSLTLYLSNKLREYRDNEHPSSTTFVAQDHTSEWYGIKLTQNIKLQNFFLDFGAEVQRRGTIASSTVRQQFGTLKSIYGKAEVSPLHQIDLAVYGRVDDYQNISRFSYGSDASVRVIDWLEMFGGYSHSFRFPTIQEQYWRDSSFFTAVTSFTPETHNFAEVGVRVIRSNIISGELSYFNRAVSDAILPMVSTSRTPFSSETLATEDRFKISGISAKATVRWWVLFAEGTAQYITQETQSEYSLPRLTASGGIYYWNKLVNDHLDLKVGFRGKFISAYDGMQYNPQTQQYTGRFATDGKAVGVGDFVLLFHIGDAYVHFIFENLLSRKYYVTPVFPQLERTLRFGVNWTFLN
jgi:outer membrane cobalamin receptor